MATWHQLQRPVQLWAENELTVVIDPPNEPRCLALFLDVRPVSASLLDKPPSLIAFSHFENGAT